MLPPLMSTPFGCLLGEFLNRQLYSRPALLADDGLGFGLEFLKFEHELKRKSRKSARLMIILAEKTEMENIIKPRLCLGCLMLSRCGVVMVGPRREAAFDTRDACGGSSDQG
jgi:hypothetical protein